MGPWPGPPVAGRHLDWVNEARFQYSRQASVLESMDPDHTVSVSIAGNGPLRHPAADPPGYAHGLLPVRGHWPPSPAATTRSRRGSTSCTPGTAGPWNRIRRESISSRRFRRLDALTRLPAGVAGGLPAELGQSHHPVSARFQRALPAGRLAGDACAPGEAGPPLRPGGPARLRRLRVCAAPRPGSRAAPRWGDPLSAARRHPAGLEQQPARAPRLLQLAGQGAAASVTAAGASSPAARSSAPSSGPGSTMTGTSGPPSAPCWIPEASSSTRPPGCSRATGMRRRRPAISRSSSSPAPTGCPRAPPGTWAWNGCPAPEHRVTLELLHAQHAGAHECAGRERLCAGCAALGCTADRMRATARFFASMAAAKAATGGRPWPGSGRPAAPSP